jgi:GAF domain-containing protein
MTSTSMQQVADQTLALITGAHGVMIGLGDHQGISYLWGAGAGATSLGTRVDLDASLSGLAIRTGQVVWSNDTTTDPRADKDAGQRISVGSAICVPLVRGKSTFGVLTATSPHTFAFTEADVATLTGLAESLSADVASARTPPPLANS